MTPEQEIKEKTAILQTVFSSLLSESRSHKAKEIPHTPDEELASRTDEKGPELLAIPNNTTFKHYPALTCQNPILT